MPYPHYKTALFLRHPAIHQPVTLMQRRKKPPPQRSCNI